MADPLKGIPHLSDAELTGSWGWMQTCVPADSPVAVAYKAELQRRGLTAAPQPLKFDVIDLTKVRRPGKRSR